MGNGAWFAESQKTWREGATIWASRVSANGSPASSMRGERNRFAMGFVEGFSFSLLFGSLDEWRR